VGLILVAVAFLVLPPLREQRRLRLLERTLQRVFLFVCSGNRLRSPMAAAICNAEIARRLHIPWADVHHASVRAISAGTRVAEAKPFKAGVRDALRRLGVPATAHTSQPLTAELVADADVVFCMTADLRSEVVAIAPSAAHKVLCLDPNGADVEEPAPGAPESLAECARRLQLLVRGRLDESDLGTHRLRPALEEGLP
jgi:protein-tyrosine-phosphatase